MTYAAYDPTLPNPATQGGTAFAQSTRDNLNAIRDAAVLGCGFPGWDELPPTGGTADQPLVLVMSKGTERIKVVQTWGTIGGEAGNVVKEAYYYSSNSGTDYTPLADDAGNYVLTLAYTAGGFDNGSTWGDTP